MDARAGQAQMHAVHLALDCPTCRVSTVLPADRGARIFSQFATFRAASGQGREDIQPTYYVSETTGAQSSECSDGADDAVSVAGRVTGCNAAWITSGLDAGSVSCCARFETCAIQPWQVISMRLRGRAQDLGIVSVGESAFFATQFVLKTSAEEIRSHSIRK